VPFVHNRRLRALGRRVPHLANLYGGAKGFFILRRGVAEIDYPGARIRVRADTEEIVHLRLRPVAKEPWTVSWIEKNLRDGDVLWDIGANVGVYSLIAASVSPAARVVAVEPGYATFASLCDNLLLNGVAETVVPLPLVLGSKTHLGSLSYRDVSAGAAIHELDSERGGAYRQPVLVYALDDLLERFELPAPTLVKLDVDGAEADVLAGARVTLRRPELRSLIVEVENQVTEPVLHELDGAGFTLVQRIDDRYGEPLPGLWYGVFERTRG
jgi:FkbM family methyltransferase